MRETGARVRVVASRPIDEPKVQHGPFVMNTPQEIERVYRNYNDGLFGRVEDDTSAVA